MCAYVVLCVFFTLSCSHSHNFICLAVAMATPHNLSGGRGGERGRGDGTEEDRTSHLTGQSSGSLNVFEGETFEGVVMRPLAL